MRIQQIIHYLRQIIHASDGRGGRKRIAALRHAMRRFPDRFARKAGKRTEETVGKRPARQVRKEAGKKGGSSCFPAQNCLFRIVLRQIRYSTAHPPAANTAKIAATQYGFFRQAGMLRNARELPIGPTVLTSSAEIAKRAP